MCLSRDDRSGRLRAIKKGHVWRIPSSVVQEDSRPSQASKRWALAATEMAAHYSETLENKSDLTALTSAPGEFYEIPESDSE